MSRLRVLVLGPECHPKRVSIPYVTYSHAAALAQLHDVTLVAGAHVEDDLRRAKAPFRAIEVVRMPLLQRIKDWGMRRMRPDSQLRTAFEYPFHIAFEYWACRSAFLSNVSGVAKSVRSLPAQGAYTLRDRAAQRRITVGSRL
jgi:hypothetical protein